MGILIVSRVVAAGVLRYYTKVFRFHFTEVSGKDKLLYLLPGLRHPKCNSLILGACRSRSYFYCMVGGFVVRVCVLRPFGSSERYIAHHLSLRPEYCVRELQANDVHLTSEYSVLTRVLFFILEIVFVSCTNTPLFLRERCNGTP